MVISRISSQDAQGNTASGSTVATTYPGATTPGNLLIAVAAFNSGAGTTISIPGWTSLASGYSATGTQPAALLAKIAVGTETTITASTTGTGTYNSISICEYTGNSNSVVSDGTASFNTNNQANTTNWTTPNITTSNSNDLLLSVVLTTSSATSPSWQNSILFAPGPGTKWAIYFGQNVVSVVKTNYNDKLTWTGNQGASGFIVAFQAVATISTPIASVQIPTFTASPRSLQNARTSRNTRKPLTIKSRSNRQVIKH